MNSSEIRQKVDLLLHQQSYIDKSKKMVAILKSNEGRELAADIVETTISVGIHHLDPELIYNNHNV